MAYDVSHPSRVVGDEVHRGFARWFWDEKSREAELVCADADFDLSFAHDHAIKYAVDTYLCYQKLYFARRQRNGPPRLDAVSPSRPLRVVFFNEFPPTSPAFAIWLDGMKSQFDVSHIDLYPVRGSTNPDKRKWDVSYLVYDFIAKSGALQAPLIGISREGPVRR
jgi:hypothetical protein